MYFVVQVTGEYHLKLTLKQNYTKKSWDPKQTLLAK